MRKSSRMALKQACLANHFIFLCLRIVFKNKNKKPFFYCFFVKKVFGKLFLKTVFENRKQYLSVWTIPFEWVST